MYYKTMRIKKAAKTTGLFGFFFFLNCVLYYKTMRIKKVGKTRLVPCFLFFIFYFCGFEKHKECQK